MSRASLIGIWVRRRRKPIRSALSGLFLISLVVPFVSANPECWNEHGGRETMWGPFEPTYKRLYLEGLDAAGVEYWEVRNLILQRWWPGWVQLLWRPSGQMEVHDAMLNSNLKSARDLLEGIWNGREIDGAIYRPTPAMLQLRAERGLGEMIAGLCSCRTLRAVAIKPA